MLAIVADVLRAAGFLPPILRLENAAGRFCDILTDKTPGAIVSMER